MSQSRHAHVVVDRLGGYRSLVGGVTALERTLWRLGKAGYVTAVIAAEPFPLRGDLPILVAWVPPETPPELDAELVRGDEVAGVVVRDAASIAAAERELLRGLGKSHQGITDAVINHHMSRPITRWLATTSVTPNQVTIVSILLGLFAAVLLCERSYPYVALGGVLIQLQSVLDSCDGELARLRFQYSLFGQWLDNVGDDLVDNAFIAGAGVAAGGIWMWLGFYAATLRLLAATAVFYEVYRKTGTGDVYQFRFWFERGKQTIDDVYDPRSPFTWLRNVGRRDTYAFAWMLLCLADLPLVVTIWGAGMGTVHATNMTIHTIKRVRGELDA
jgi:phosphatidylglycerophosphate synthase